MEYAAKVYTIPTINNCIVLSANMTQQIRVKVSVQYTTPLKTHNEQSNLESDIQSKVVCVCVCVGGGGGVYGRQSV